MPLEVVEAMREAAKSGWLIDMNELLRKAGEQIAEICEAEAAFVTSGATAALTLAAAACMTGKDRRRMDQLPDTEGLKNEIIIQRGRSINYTRAFRFAGAKIVEVGCSYPYVSSLDGNEASLCGFGNRPRDIENAITDHTAAIADTESIEVVRKNIVPAEEIIAIARKHDVPTVLDVAGELPPASNLRKFASIGADLVIFSGGKAICGPNNTGLIIGKRDLIEACALQAHPNSGIGRGFKVSKEDIVGLVVALKRYVSLDFSAVLEKEMTMARYIFEETKNLPGISSKLIFPDDTNRPIPIVQLTLDENTFGIGACDLKRKLISGNPSIHVFHTPPSNIIRIYVTDTLLDGDERIVTKELKNALADGNRNPQDS